MGTPRGLRRSAGLRTGTAVQAAHGMQDTSKECLVMLSYVININNIIYKNLVIMKYIIDRRQDV